MSDEEQTLEEEIRSDAERRADRIRRKARRQAESIIEEAREKAEEQRERIRERAKKKAEAKKRRLRARLQQEAQNLRRETYQQMLEELRGRALEELERLPEKERYPQVLLNLALAALDQMQGERFELVLKESDRDRSPDLPERISKAASERFHREVEVTLSEETLDALGGVVLRSADGHQVADQTFRARLDRLWDQMREKLAEIIPPPASGEQ